MIRDFLMQFTADELGYETIGAQYCSVPPQLGEVRESIPDEPFSIGTLLGTGNKHFVPSLALLQWLGDHTEMKAVVDEKAAWLFICGRDIFSVAIQRCAVDRGLVLVCNQKGEVLGYGEMSRKGIKNKRHLGEYLHESP